MSEAKAEDACMHPHSVAFRTVITYAIARAAALLVASIVDDYLQHVSPSLKLRPAAGVPQPVSKLRFRKTQENGGDLYRWRPGAFSPLSHPGGMLTRRPLLATCAAHCSMVLVCAGTLDVS